MSHRRNVCLRRKTAFTSLPTGKLFGFNVVIHFEPIMCYKS